MALMKWDDLSNNEKLDRLSTVLTRAGSDVKFRDRCLASPDSAKEVLKEAGEIEFPPDFNVKFITPEEQLKNLVLVLPDYIPAQDGAAENRNAEDYQPCTYNLWRT